ncbi:MAG: MaoC/PaaZ C-terminal domain-containing protein [Gemmataceae bacterium]
MSAVSPYYFDEVEIGQEWVSTERDVSEQDVLGFAALSGDFNPIHVDAEFARSTPFRKQIAHGLLVLSIGSGLIAHSPLMQTLAFLGMKEWQFLAPVFFGDRIHVRGKLLDKELRGRGKRGVLTWQRQIFNQDGKVVQEGLLQTLVACQPVQVGPDCASAASR